MKGLDLSKFKKIDEDDNKTTLQHPDGHSIVVAVGALTPKLRDELKKLPKVPGMKNVLDKLPPEPGYTEPKKMAAGGKVKMLADAGTPEDAPTADDVEQSADPAQDQTAPTQDMDPNSPAPVQDDSAQASPDQQPPAMPDVAPEQQASPDQPQQSGPPTQGQAMGPQLPAQPTVPLTPQEHGANVAQEIKQEDQNIQSDIDQGHITPLTMAQMFHDKSLPGKIGTIFGMLMSGMGSGLTHQPNMLMEMMQKQIDNDLNAQKSSAENAQNAYRLTQAHQMQQATIKKMDIDNQIAQIDVALRQSKNPSEINELNARAANLQSIKKNTDADTAIKTDTLSHNLANRVAAASQKAKIDVMPDTVAGPGGVQVPNPQKQRAMQAYGLMFGGMNDTNSNYADRAGAMSALVFGANNTTAQPQQGAQSNVVPYAPGQAPQQPQQGSTDPEADYKQQQNGLRMTGNPTLIAKANDNDARHIPGIAQQSSVPVTDADRNYLNSSQTFMSQLKRFRDWTAAHSGDLSPSDKAFGQSLAQEVQNSYGQARGYGVFNPQEGDFIGKNIDPDPTKFFNNIRVLPKLDAVRLDTNVKYNSYLKNKLGITPTRVINGVTYSRGPDGKMVKVQ